VLLLALRGATPIILISLHSFRSVYRVLIIYMNNKVTIKIPRELYRKLGTMIEGTGFSSVTEFIVFVMRSLASGEVKEEDRLTAEEIRMIRERLKKLDYL